MSDSMVSTRNSKNWSCHGIESAGGGAAVGMVVRVVGALEKVGEGVASSCAVARCREARTHMTASICVSNFIVSCVCVCWATATKGWVMQLLGVGLLPLSWRRRCWYVTRGGLWVEFRCGSREGLAKKVRLSMEEEKVMCRCFGEIPTHFSIASFCGCGAQGEPLEDCVRLLWRVMLNPQQD